MTAQMQEALSALELAKSRVSELMGKCEHEIVPTLPESIEASEGICNKCGYKTGSWYCPDNPPKMRCEYRSGDEWCIHCGNPEERK